MKRYKILYGVCGIGNGHTYRQLPIIDKLSQDNTLIILAYSNSLKYYTNYFEGNPNVTILEVAVPYYAGNNLGLDFLKTAQCAEDSGENFIAKNARAMDKVNRLMGKPDLVICDYEPVSAQYAYAYSAPLITIDQQSKYLIGDFPDELSGQRYIDEVMRLNMFFPVAHLRLACSFFTVTNNESDRNVLVVPPVLRPEIEHIKTERKVEPNSVLVYLTSQDGFTQPLDQIIQILGCKQDHTFHIFVPSLEHKIQDTSSGNVIIHAHGAPEFDQILSTCPGLVTTAGHSLLAEAMYLGIPVYAMPLPIYEQQMNANIIQKYAFGINAASIDKLNIDKFLDGIPVFKNNIEKDSTVLLRRNGLTDILKPIKLQLKTGDADVYRQTT